MIKNLRLLTIIIIVLLLIYLVAIPLLFRDEKYVLHVFILCSQISIVALTVRGIYVSGELTFGQVAFVMIGAYSSALLTTQAGLSFWFALPLSGLLAAVFASLIGFPMLRLKGTYFCMSTLILAEFLKHVVKVSEFLGSNLGFYNIPRPSAIQIGTFTIVPEFTPYDRLPYFYTIALLLVIAMATFRRLDNSPPGMVFRAIQQDDRLAASLGINVIWYRIKAFAISAFFAGLVGSFSAHYMTVFYPETFSVWDSIHYVLYAFIGGIGYLGGPIVGTFTLIWLWEFLHAAVGLQMVVFAATIVVVILFLPGGLFSLEKFVPSWRTSLRRRLLR